MGQLLTSPWVILFAVGVTLLALAVPLWRMVQVYRGSSSRRPVDASDLELVPTAEVAPTLAALRRLGFERLGEAQLDLPSTRARHTIWVMVDADRTVVAEVAHVGGNEPIVSLNSIFSDESVVETLYPRGESIHDPDFHSGHNPRSLDRAYDDQRLEADRWRLRHGGPRPINDMAAYLRADATYRERYAKRQLRGPLVRRQLLPAAIIAGIILALAVALLVRWPV